MLSLKKKKVFSDCNIVYESYKKCINIPQSINSCEIPELQLYNCFLDQLTKSEKAIKTIKTNKQTK